MDSHHLCLDPEPSLVTGGLVRSIEFPSTASSPSLPCLLANSEAEEVKQTTIAFRSVLPGVRVEAVYSLNDAMDWASKEAWPMILFAERLAIGERLSDILLELRARAPHAAIVVQGEQDVPPRFLLADNSPGDYYWTHRLGHAGSELPLLMLRLIEKRDLRRRLGLSDRLGKHTEAVLSNVTALVRSITEYYDTGREERGYNIGRRVPDKLLAAEQSLTELATILASRRQAEETMSQGVLSEATRTRRWQA
jgi:hypothetical protein